MIDWGNELIVIASAVAVGESARRWVVKPIAELLERSRLRDEDWNGVLGRPGVPGRPGVMAVLGEHSESLTTLKGFAAEAADRFVTLESDREAAHEEALKMWEAIKAVAQATPPGV